MSVSGSQAREIHAKVVYFGPQGSGTSENVRYIHRKLRSEHRGELRTSQVRGDSNAQFEFLPIELGSVNGANTSIHLYTVPGGDKYAKARRRLLEEADGVVFVADLRPTRHEATVKALDELRGHLTQFGRHLEDLVLILQYNRRDLADENAVEALHRKLGLEPDAVFEAVASEGTGVLQTLTSLSKLILRQIRREVEEPEEEAAESRPAPQAKPSVREPAAPLEETRAFDAPPVEADVSVEPEKGFEVESAGPAEAAGSEVRVPVVLVEPATGRRIEFRLRLTLEGP
jgi:signal recognition particle receptor subunit beta